MPLTTGQVLRERYRIVELLGQGGFRAVYNAWDTTFEVACAVKENSEASPEAQRQFLLEARLLHNLRHPNLPLVKDYFVIEGQGQYLVMDYVDGEDLQEKLDAAGGPLPEVAVLAWASEVCEALQYLHAQNPPVIHRDIKPANLKITPQGKVVLVDFGIAKQSDPTRPTTKGAQAATPGYAPFEQYGQASTDARSDLYSLGATLYHLLTGRVPVESISRMRGVTLDNPRMLNPHISPHTEAAVLHAMSLQPEGRCQSSGELLSELRLPQTEKVIVDRGTRTQPYAQPEPGYRKRTSMPWPLLGGVVALLVLCGMVFGLGSWIAGRLEERNSSRTALARSDLTETALAASSQTVVDTRIPTQETLPTASQQLDGLTQTAALDLTRATLAQASQTARAVEFTKTAAAQEPEGMLLIPAGEFQMGSESGESDERPVHDVYLDAFYIDIYEVTNALYAECVQAGACSKPDCDFYGNSSYQDHPVVCVDWRQARAFCQWQGRDLPTEAQWEKAARSRLEGKLYPWGDETPVCTQSASNGAQFSGCDGDTVSVGSFRPNRYGLFDMAGNVWEWVLDWYLATFYARSSSKNPSGPAIGYYRMLRGGSWLFDGSFLRVANRNGNDPINSGISIGFRCSRLP